MIELLVTIILYVLVLGLAWWLIGMLPIDGKFKQVIQVALILICILLLVGLLFGEVPVIQFRQ